MTLDIKPEFLIGNWKWWSK